MIHDDVQNEDNRERFINSLKNMPVEAFSWIIASSLTNIFPDGLVGFSEENRASIIEMKTAAQEYLSKIS